MIGLVRNKLFHFLILGTYFGRFLTIFGQFYHDVQSNGENFQVGVFAFLTSDSVSTHNYFSLENLFFTNQELNFLSIVCHPNASQILNDVL